MNFRKMTILLLSTLVLGSPVTAQSDTYGNPHLRTREPAGKAAMPLAAARFEGTYELVLETPVKEVVWVSVFPRENGLWLQLQGKTAQRLEPESKPGSFRTADPGGFTEAAGTPVALSFKNDPSGPPRLEVCAREIRWAGSRVTPVLTETQAPRAVTAVLSVAEMQEDFRRLRRLLLHVHPDPVAFIPRRALETFLNAQGQRIKAPMSVQAFGAILAPAMARVHCGHTRLATPAGYWEHFKDGFFPLRLQIAGDRAWIAQAGSKTFPAGSELLALDGASLKDVIADLRGGLSTDGENISAQDSQLNTRFPSLYALRYGTRPMFQVTFRRPGAKEDETTTVAGVARTTVTKAQEDVALRYGSSPDRRLGFEARPDLRTGILTIRSFGYYRNPEVFKVFVDDAFRKVREAGLGSLILDLRDNSGGDPFCSTHLLSYLERTPIPYFAREYGTRYAPMAKPIPRAKDAFQGHLFVLMDGGCFSSTTHLLALMKHHRIGTLVGTDAGGTYVCNDGSQTYTLPASGYRLSVPRRSFAVAVERLPKGQGIQPDAIVNQRPEDLAAGIDTQREYALRLAAKGRPTMP